MTSYAVVPLKYDLRFEYDDDLRNLAAVTSPGEEVSEAETEQRQESRRSRGSSSRAHRERSTTPASQPR